MTNPTRIDNGGDLAHTSRSDSILRSAPESWPLPAGVAGIELPASDLARDTTQFVRQITPPVVFNHCVRVFLLGSVLAQFRGVEIDAELFYLGAICHDLGQTERFMGERRFEVEGADAAAEWLTSQGVERSRVDTVWDAIAFRTHVGIVEYKQPEIALVAEGAVIDLVGGDPATLAMARVAQIVDAIPRGSFKTDDQRVLAEQVRRRPLSTTFANFLSEVGERHVPWVHPALLVRRHRQRAVRRLRTWDARATQPECGVRV